MSEIHEIIHKNEPDLIERVAKRLASWDHPRKQWPDGLGNYRDKQYREHYLESARVIIRMIKE